jgi:hypothetical protein
MADPAWRLSGSRAQRLRRDSVEPRFGLPKQPANENARMKAFNRAQPWTRVQTKRSTPKHAPARLYATTAPHPRAGLRGPRPCRRCAPYSKMRTLFQKCASWKSPEIPSKVRTVFQDAHENCASSNGRSGHARKSCHKGCISRAKPSSLAASGRLANPVSRSSPRQKAISYRQAGSFRRCGDDANDLNRPKSGLRIRAGQDEFALIMRPTPFRAPQEVGK